MGSHRVGHDWSDLAAAAVKFQQEKCCFLLNAELTAVLGSYRSPQISSKLSEDHLKSCPGTNAIFTLLSNLGSVCFKKKKKEQVGFSYHSKHLKFQSWVCRSPSVGRILKEWAEAPAGAPGGASPVIAEKPTEASRARRGQGPAAHLLFVFPSLNISSAETSSIFLGWRPSNTLATDF